MKRLSQAATMLVFVAVFLGCGGKNSVIIPGPPFIGFLNEREAMQVKWVPVVYPRGAVFLGIHGNSYVATEKSRERAGNLAKKLGENLVKKCGWKYWNVLKDVIRKKLSVVIGEVGKENKVVMVVFLGHFADSDSKVIYRGWRNVSDFETEEGLAEIVALIYRAKDAN